VVLGDRFETFCMAAAAQICRVPVAHIHGGELTEGVIDEAFRHCITKMSHLHFASCEIYRQRIIQLGETPERVFNVGALGVENIKKAQLMSREELSESIGFILDGPFFLVTFHPVTLEKGTAELQFQAILDALEYFPEHKVIITKTNADIGGRVINRMLEQYSEKQQDRVIGIASLGMVRYLSAMRYAAAVIGNSSSGIIEAPTFKVPTVNIGDRQKGRIQAESVINCSPEKDDIIKSIQLAISPVFRDSLKGVVNPYEKNATAEKIKDIIMKEELGHTQKKKFYDITMKYNLSNPEDKAKQ
jgi:GDP/UDP-N,N'-diacetylbacillosamine 2-epimerase (hydrolysing)